MTLDKIPPEALVIRDGRNRSEDIERGIVTHPSGITEISVESAVELSIRELAEKNPHGQIGVTTVGEVRTLGGNVI